MGIVVLFISLFSLSLLCLILFKILNKKYYDIWSKYNDCYQCYEWDYYQKKNDLVKKYTREDIDKLSKKYSKIETCSRIDYYISIGTLITSFLVLLFMSVGICCVNGFKEKDYQLKLQEKEILEYRVEHQQDNIVGNELLYNDILEFNQELYKVKRGITING